MICPRCNANNDNNEQFCYNCGLRLERPTVAPEGAPTIVIPPPPQQSPPSYAPPQQSPPSYTPPSSTPSVYDAPASPPYQTPSYGAQPYGTSQPTYSTVPTTSTAAIVSLIAGILSWLIPIGIGAIVAVVAGHMARGTIRRSNNTLGGSGMALAGLILGYLNLLVGVLLCVLIAVVTVIGVNS